MSKHKRDAKRVASWQPRTNRRSRRNAAYVARVFVTLQAIAANAERYASGGTEY